MNQEDLDNWEETISKYIDENGLLQHKFEKSSPRTIKLKNTLSEIARAFSNKFKSHDSLNILPHNRTPQEVQINSHKFNTTIYFGFDVKGFYLNNVFSFQKHLKSINDKFLKEMISLWDYGEVEIRRSYCSDSKLLEQYQKQTVYNKSEILKILSSIIFKISEDNRLDDLDIEVKPGRDKSFEKTMLDCQNIFETLYGLNYKLYKVEYLKLRRQKD